MWVNKLFSLQPSILWKEKTLWIFILTLLNNAFIVDPRHFHISIYIGLQTIDSHHKKCSHILLITVSETALQSITCLIQKPDIG